MTRDRPHSVLVPHYPVPSSYAGQLVHGYAPRGCLACNEAPSLRCWCGGEVGFREPGDALGLGCLENITHNWRADGPDTHCEAES